MPEQLWNQQHDHSIRGLGRIRKKPEKFRRQRRTFLRTTPSPREFRTTAVAATTVDLAWANAAGDLTGRQTRIQSRDVATKALWDWGTGTDVATTVVAQQITGLTASTEYEFRIHYFDSVGRSRYNILRATTTA